MKQHFYSRVPSRIAMFYKSNGFDTFACSEDVSRDLIEKDLAILLEQRLSPEELGLLRNDKLSPVYCHFSTKDGDFIESCVSFLNSDYTGERSSYLVHSLLFDEKEEKLAHYNDKYKTIIKDMYINDLSSFDITSPQAKPDRMYPEKAWKNEDLSEPIKWLIERFDALTLKKLIFALTLAICGKYKSVYVVIPNGENTDVAVKFFNSIIMIFPYHMRKYLSFVSRVHDFNKYSGFKFKIMSDKMGIAPQNKGVTINFISNLTYNIKDSDLKIAGIIPDFLYRLINHDEERYAFFNFVNRIVTTIPDFKGLDIKVLVELVSLFRSSCGFYEEKTVLPDDDSIMNYLNIYEKYRDGLTDEYRMNGMMAFKRYPNNYVLIPRTVFNKLTKIYPDEIAGTKHIIMNVCLDLIHTDLMRSQLFAFIRSSYDAEDEESKESILKNLANVLYGGFLLSPIIEMFKKYFDTQKEEIREIILRKLFLSIRTNEIQQPLFEFVSEKYNIFTESEKELFYNVAAEHLPEGDELAKNLLNLCDTHILEEPDELKNYYSKALCKVLLKEDKTKEKLLLPLVSASSGFTFYEITKVVFTSWRKRKIATEFITLSCKGTLAERVTKIVKMWELVQNEIEDNLMKKFINAVIDGFDANPCQCEVGEIFDAQVNLVLGLQMVDNPLSDSFALEFNTQVINKLLKKALVDVFKSPTPEAVEKVVNYAQYNEIIKQEPNYPALELYLKIKEAIKVLDYDLLFNSLDEIMKYKEVTKKVATYLSIDVINKYNNETFDDLINENLLICYVVTNKLRYNQYRFSNVYDNLIEMMNKVLGEDVYKMKVQEYTCILIKKIIEIAIKLEKVNNEYKEDVRNNENGLSPVIKDIFKKYGMKQLKLIYQPLKPSQDFDKYVQSQTKGMKSTAGLFAKVVKV